MVTNASEAKDNIFTTGWHLLYDRGYSPVGALFVWQIRNSQPFLDSCFSPDFKSEISYCNFSNKAVFRVQLSGKLQFYWKHMTYNFFPWSFWIQISLSNLPQAVNCELGVYFHVYSYYLLVQLFYDLNNMTKRDGNPCGLCGLGTKHNQPLPLSDPYFWSRALKEYLAIPT